jgi:hypothetical protein
MKRSYFHKTTYALNFILGLVDPQWYSVASINQWIEEWAGQVRIIGIAKMDLQFRSTYPENIV